LNLKFLNENTKYTINSLNDDNLKDLYAYFNSFTEEEKEYFGFPLFRPVNKSYLDFKNSFNLWKSEGSAWNVFLLYKEECAEVLAVSYKKKMNHKSSKNEEFKSPTWFNSVKRKYRIYRIKKDSNFRFSHLMGLIVLEQARLKKIKHLYARGRSNNKAVHNYLRSLGYKETGREFNVVKKNLSWKDIEYEINVKN
jgi:hypothetical protein